MYSTNSATNRLINSYNRRFKATVTLSNEEEISDEIVRIDGSVDIPGTDIAPGMVLSQGVTITLSGYDYDLSGETFVLHLSGRGNLAGRTSYRQLEEYQYIELEEFTYEELSTTDIDVGQPIPMGRYTVDKALKKGGRYSITAYDGLYASDVVYDLSNVYPTPLTLTASSSDIEADICSKLGILYDAARLPVGTSVPRVKIPTGATIRDMLSWLASFAGGKSAMLDREGYLVYKSITEIEGYTVEKTRADEPTAGTTVEITRAVCWLSGSNSIVKVMDPEPLPSRAATFTNPLMVDQIMTYSIAPKYLGLTFTPLDVLHRMGDPRLDPLDKIKVKNKNNDEFDIILTNMSWTYDVGFSASLKCSASTPSSSQGPITRAINSANNSSSQADSRVDELAQRVNNIIGANGGYVILRLDTNGKPVAMLYTDSSSLSQAVNVLRIDENGICSSNNGAEGTFTPVIGIDGSIPVGKILPLEYDVANLTEPVELILFKNGTTAVFSIDSLGNVKANDIQIRLSDSASTYTSLRDYINNHP